MASTYSARSVAQYRPWASPTYLLDEPSKIISNHEPVTYSFVYDILNTYYIIKPHAGSQFPGFLVVQPQSSASSHPESTSHEVLGLKSSKTLPATRSPKRR
jgi:hypothetical protein